MIARLLLVLALIASLASAAPEPSRGQCTCFRTRSRLGPTWAIQDMQIYPPSKFCKNIEIVVHLQNGVQYCLDPKAKKVQEIVQKLQNRNSAPTEDSADLWATEILGFTGRHGSGSENSLVGLCRSVPEQDT